MRGGRGTRWRERQRARKRILELLLFMQVSGHGKKTKKMRYCTWSCELEMVQLEVIHETVPSSPPVEDPTRHGYPVE